VPNLFPDAFTEAKNTDNSTISNNNKTFGNSFKFDFETGEFVLSPSGKFVRTVDYESWVEWCQKALFTPRYRFLTYDDAYGQEFESLIGQVFTRLAIESEIKRMAAECLKAHPMTDKVTNFTFTWDADMTDTIVFSCEISNVLGDTAKINGSAVIV
jgi:hypothetical protein